MFSGEILLLLISEDLSLCGYHYFLSLSVCCFKLFSYKMPANLQHGHHLLEYPSSNYVNCAKAFSRLDGILLSDRMFSISQGGSWYREQHIPQYFTLTKWEMFMGSQNKASKEAQPRALSHGTQGHQFLHLWIKVIYHS